MTIEEIADEVAGIRAAAAAFDDESAHVGQDGLYRRVLMAIAEGAGDPADLAAEALKAEDVRFARWYA